MGTTKITQENQYEFLFWAFERKPENIEADMFTQLLNSQLPELIKNEETWEVGFTNIMDLFIMQSKMLTSTKSQEPVIPQKKNVKPASREERAKLFAEAATKRYDKKFQKKQKRIPKNKD